MPSRAQLAEADDKLQRARNIIERTEIPHLTFNPASWELLAAAARELTELATDIAQLLRQR
jgi:hypothetical protein